MADNNNFEEFKKNLKAYLSAKNMIISDEDALKAAFDKDSAMDFEAAEAFAKVEESENAGKDEPAKDGAPVKGDEPKNTDSPGTVVNEGGVAAPAEELQNLDWQDSILNEWKTWATEKNLIADKYIDVDPDKKNNLCIKLFASNDDKTKDEYSADLQYVSATNLSLRSKDGKVPAQNVFDKMVAIAKKNGPVINFGDIKSNDFKARLMIACLNDPEIKMVGAPTAEEMKSWPKDLQDKVAAVSKDNNRKDEAIKKIQTLRDKINKANKDSEADLKVAEEAAKSSGKKFSISDADKVTHQHMDLTEEEKKLRELRDKSKAGDKDAAKELLEMRNKTLTDDYKYEKVPEMEADGKTPKVDEKGKPVYKKDENGNPVYKKNEKGQKVFSAPYMAMRKKLKAFSK